MQASNSVLPIVSDLKEAADVAASIRRSFRIDGAAPSNTVIGNIPFDQLLRCLGLGLMPSDRSRATLNWRYHDRPPRRFRVTEFVRDEELPSYVVCEAGQPKSEWSMQDIVVTKEGDLRCMLVLAIGRWLLSGEGERHPLCAR